MYWDLFLIPLAGRKVAGLLTEVALHTCSGQAFQNRAELGTQNIAMTKPLTNLKEEGLVLV